MEPRYHLTGVMGVGMSALAQVLTGNGYAVTGSDRQRDRGQSLETAAMLERAGVRFTPQDGTGTRLSPSAVVVSTAIEEDNADVLAARQAGIPILHRADLLARLMEGKRCVAVTGTSGKTTVTGMIGWILEKLGWDPTVVNGGIVLNWATGNRMGNARCGKSDLWVAEVDESDRSLLRFHPDWAVITNASKDHFEMEETRRLFQSFATQVKRGIVNGLEAACWESFFPDVTDSRSRFVYQGMEFDVPLPGRHNAENAWCAVMLCEKLGGPLSAIREALAAFRGIHRRLEWVGEAGGVRVMDDHAHNPAKIRAAWSAAASHLGRVVGVWRPHGYGPLAKMTPDLTGVFREMMRSEDRLFLLPVFDAGGTADRSIGSREFARTLKDAGVRVETLEEGEAAIHAVADEAREGDVVLIMGARDPGLPAFARGVWSEIRRRTEREGWRSLR